MADKAEACFAIAYRDARKAFIAACEHAHGGSIARVHPTALSPDGSHLFIDSVAFGSREAANALLVITGANGEAGLLGSRVLAALLESEVMPLPGTRLVLVHALNPFGFAWGRQTNEDGLALDDPRAGRSWSFAMLTAIATEDLARTLKLLVLEVDKGRHAKLTDARGGGAARVLADFRAGLDLRAARLTLPAADAPILACRVVARALATL
jgi:hypothetical protein